MFFSEVITVLIWSCALYKGLNYIEYTDGSEICNINRDDASG